MTAQIQLTELQKYLLGCFALIPEVKLSARELFEFLGVDQDSLLHFFEALEELKDFGWLHVVDKKYVMAKEDAMMVRQIEWPTAKKYYKFINYFVRLYGDVSSADPLKLYKYELLVISILENLEEDSNTKAALLNSYANYLFFRKKTEQASVLMHQAVIVQERVNPENPNLAIYYNDLCKLEQSKGNVDLAKKYANKAIELITRREVNEYVADILINSYYLLGDIFHSTKEYRLALTFFLRAIEVANTKLSSNKDVQILLHNQIANLYRKTGDLENARLHLKKAIEKHSKTRSNVVPASKLSEQLRTVEELIRQQNKMKKLKKYAVYFAVFSAAVLLGTLLFMLVK